MGHMFPRLRGPILLGLALSVFFFPLQGLLIGLPPKFQFTSGLTALCLAPQFLRYFLQSIPTRSVTT